MLRAGESKPFIRNIFTLNTCSNIAGSQVIAFKEESKLLSEWSKFLQQVDPDMIIGYNISGFDLPYLMDRSKHLKVTDFPYLGRLNSTYSFGSSSLRAHAHQSKHRQKKPTSLRRLTGSVTLKRHRWKADCNLISCNSCRGNTSFEAILSTLSVRSFWGNRRRKCTTLSSRNSRTELRNRGDG